MPNMSQLHVDALLSNLSVAFKNEKTEFVSEQVCPKINVKKESDLYYVFDDETYFGTASEGYARARGGNYRGFDWSGSASGVYSCQEYGLEMAIDDRDYAQYDAPVDLEKTSMESLMERLLLAQEKRVADMAFDPAVITQGTTLVGGDQWNNFSTSDPVIDIETAKSTVKGVSGMSANAMVLGWEVWSILRHHSQIRDYYKYTQSGPLSEEMVKGALGLKYMFIGGALNNTAKAGQTASLDYIWGKKAMVFYLQESPGLKKPGLMFQFNARDWTTEKYRREEIRSNVIRQSQIVDEKLVSSRLGYLIQAAVA